MIIELKYRYNNSSDYIHGLKHSMCSIDIPSIFVGRRSELVGIQLDQLTDRILPADIDKKAARVRRSLYLNNDGYGGTDASANYGDGEKKNVSPSMKKCAHIFHAVTDYCSICALNDEMALGSINRLLESSDYPSQIMVMNDTATPFGTSMNSLIFGYLRDEVPVSYTHLTLPTIYSV